MFLIKPSEHSAQTVQVLNVWLTDYFYVNSVNEAVYLYNGFGRGGEG